MTTYRPTVFFGADGNSGDKSAEEQAVSGRKRPKVPETARKTFQPLFGSRMSGVRVPSLRQKFRQKADFILHFRSFFALF